MGRLFSSIRVENKYCIDEQDKDYQQFIDCYIQGASFQDVYSRSCHGFACRKRQAIQDEEHKKRRMRAGKMEFLRYYAHLNDLAYFVDTTFSLNGKNVLDFGCGTGALSISMASRGAKVTGIDPNFLNLRAAQYRSRYFRCSSQFNAVRVHSFPRLPFKEKMFDIVITNSVLEFIMEERREYVQLLLKFLKPGGILIISTENGYYPFDYYTGAFLTLLNRKQHQNSNTPFGLTYREITEWVSQSGLNITNLSGKNLFNSIDKLINRARIKGASSLVLQLVGLLNKVLKCSCRLFRIPSDLFFPYTTFLFCNSEPEQQVSQKNQHQTDVLEVSAPLSTEEPELVLSGIESDD